MNQDLYLHGLIGGTGGGAPTTSWERPSDWLQIPALSPSDDKIYLLVKIVENTTANYLGLTCTGVGDSIYNVDWGDGNSETVHTGVLAEHQYDLADISGETLTSEGWRQALVTITPVATVLTAADFTTTHSLAGNSTNPIIQVNANCPSMTSLVCGGLDKLTIVELGENSITDFQYMFNSCNSLKSVPVLNTSSGTNFLGLFNGCSSLLSVPTIDASSGTNFDSMFSGCSSLTSVPLIDTSSALNFANMFYNCHSLTTIPLLNSSSVTNFRSMFSYCYSLTSIPLMDTSSSASFEYMFYNCTSLTTIPLIDTFSCNNFSYMFFNCISLTVVPTLNTLSGLYFDGMFYGCSNLDTIPAFDLISATSLSNMFYYVYGIKVLNMIDIGTSLSLNNMCLDRDNLVNIFKNLSTIDPDAHNLEIYGNPGVTDLTEDDIALATAKGWIVYY